MSDADGPPTDLGEDTQAPPEPPRRLDVEAAAYLIVRGGLGVREFLRIRQGSNEWHLILAAIQRAQEIKRREDRELAQLLAQALAGSKGGESG